MVIDDKVLDSLTEQARKSERLRANLDLRNSSADSSQRMLNAIEPGSVVPVHKHPSTSETVIVLRGCVKEILYSETGEYIEEHILRAGGHAMAMQIPVDTYHTLESMETGSVICEFKDGPYDGKMFTIDVKR